MKDLEESTKAVIEKFALLIRQVIQKNLHRGDAIDTEDVEQEVRLKIWHFLKKGKRVDNLPSYIKKVAYSTTIDELRKMMKQRPSGQPDNLQKIFCGTQQVAGPVAAFSPEARYDDGEAGKTIRTMVDSLSENRKKVLQLYLTGLSIEEISLSLDWEKATVRHLFYRGIDDLKEKIRAPTGSANGPLAGSGPGGAKS
jgi:RNA polymerase sigma factor (sigma-70 family)